MLVRRDGLRVGFSTLILVDEGHPLGGKTRKLSRELVASLLGAGHAVPDLMLKG